MKKGCIWSLGIVTALFLLTWLVLLILQHTVAAWPDPVLGVRLQPSRPVLAEADVKPDNAFYYIRQWKAPQVKINTKTYGDELDRWRFIGPAGAPYPDWDASLAAHAENIALDQKAAELPNCQVPLPLEKIEFKELDAMRGQCILLCYRAETAAAKGDWKMAECDFRTALALSCHITRGGMLIHRLFGITGHGIATAAIRRTVLEQNPPPEFLRKMEVVLAGTVRGLEPLSETIRQERRGGLYMIRTSRTLLSDLGPGPWPAEKYSCWAFHNGLLSPLGSSPSKTTMHMDVFFSRLIAACETNDLQAVRQATFQINDDIRHKMRNPVRMTNDPIGVLFASFVFPSLCKSYFACLSERADLDSTRLVLGVRRWQFDHGGKPPAALADLVPGYISVIPEDPFSPQHEPLRYRTDDTGWAVYSVGDDGRDGGGRYSQLVPSDRGQHPNELDLMFDNNEFRLKRDRYEEEHPLK